jgi:hypothetical protein
MTGMHTGAGTDFEHLSWARLGRAGRIRRGHVGFTLAELMTAMCVMALAACAAAALGKAVSDGWRASEQASDLSLASQGVTRTIDKLLSGARFIGVTYADSAAVTAPGGNVGALLSLDPVAPSGETGAACLFWMGNPDSMNAMLVKDVALLAHDKTSRSLRLWRVPPDNPNANQQLTKLDLTGDAKAVEFRNRPGVQSVLVAQNVAECRFTAYTVNSSDGPRAVELFIRMADGALSSQRYTTITPPASGANPP